MKTLRSFVFACSLVILAGMTSHAQSPMSIIDHIMAGRVNSVTQSNSITQLLKPAQQQPDEADIDESETEDRQTPASTLKAIGYRVQVFSDNNPRTAKNEARRKQRSIAERFPHYRTYVTYTSPYWRLKVGDFRSQSEAQAAANELRQEFPAYSKEIRVVRDRVNLTE